jgi:hypothetical protein
MAGCGEDPLERVERRRGPEAGRRTPGLAL